MGLYPLELNLKRQLTAYFRWQHLMNIDFSSHDIVHLLGESATHPIELCCGTLAALLLLAGTSPKSSVAPCQRTASQPTRARPTAVFRLKMGI
jgi:hypothetical protein